jgi:hypothetical protein
LFALSLFTSEEKLMAFLDLPTELKQDMLHEFTLFLQDLNHELNKV